MSHALLARGRGMRPWRIHRNAPGLHTFGEAADRVDDGNLTAGRGGRGRRLLARGNAHREPQQRHRQRGTPDRVGHYLATQSKTVTPSSRRATACLPWAAQSVSARSSSRASACSCPPGRSGQGPKDYPREVHPSSRPAQLRRPTRSISCSRFPPDHIVALQGVRPADPGPVCSGSAGRSAWTPAARCVAGCRLRPQGARPLAQARCAFPRP